MTTTAHQQHYADLRAWARGDLTYEAATELLIRTGWAASAQPWMGREDDRPFIHFAAIPDHTGPMSGGERRLLTIAASIAAGTTVSLGDALTGLDRPTSRLVLAAVAHASGLNHEGPVSYIEAGELRRRNVTAEYPWPDEESR